MSEQKRILLIIGGGIAAYKTLELIRLCKKAGVAVTPILTRGGQQFVTPLSVSGLAGEKTYTDLFDLTDEAEMGHIQLSRIADLVVVAPATADLMAKMATGQADDLATTALLATDKPVLMAPAMNVRMWQHPATRRNLETLKGDGVLVTGPEDGDMACGEYGPGRMSEAADIFAAIEKFYGGQSLPAQSKPDVSTTGPLAGRKVLITAGPTHEPIDPVRYIANRSSGKQGYALAETAIALGAEVALVSGPVGLPIPPGVELINVETARDMLKAVQGELPCDMAIFCAAVADWRAEDNAQQKMKKDGSGKPPDLKLAENPDILKSVGHLKNHRPALVVGFAAETENVVDNARKKLTAKNADIIVANDVSDEAGVMGGRDNTVHLVGPDTVEDWEKMSKRDVAVRLMDRFAAMLAENT
ncbi:MAG: bifunctional phosphopantothenoylcysteine decarboxylase/phosphopantothenate--cysteine ligase CoaBC [Anderseniella sp.]|nr:bifunctional phosphopantothenoylcysteine decarboxylase/phosphopantothenate--cysteine ligase CoaBC [Anderseniella sp.]